MAEGLGTLKVKPECFTRNENVKKFLKQYSMTREVNSWDDNKVRFLSIFF